MSPRPTLDLYALAGSPWRFIDHLGPQWAEPPPEFGGSITTNHHLEMKGWPLRLNTPTALAHLYSIAALNRWERGSIDLRRESREYIYMAYMKMYV